MSSPGGAESADPAGPAPVPMAEAHLAAARAAKGFMPPDEGLALYDAAWAMAPYGPLLEIGTYAGKSATYLGAAAAARGGLVVTVDHHHGSEENQPGWEHHDASVVDPVTGRMDTLPQFRHTMHAAGLEASVIAVVAESTTVASLWATPLALLFIDGGHGEDPAQADYTAWSPKLLRHGVLAIHDVFPDPADGGQAPYHVFLRALRDGFVEVRRVGSLRVLRRV